MFPDNSIDFESKDVVSSFDKSSFKNVSLCYTSTLECYVPCSIRENIYLISPSIENDTTSEILRNTTSEAHVPSIENVWGVMQSKTGKNS